MSEISIDNHGVRRLDDGNPVGVSYHTVSRPEHNPHNVFNPKNETILSNEGIREEMQVIKDKLNCNAVRIVGHSSEELVRAGVIAKETGLAPWFSPRFVNATLEQTQEHLQEFYDAARQMGLENSSLIIANELPFDCADATGTYISDYEERVRNYVDNYLKQGKMINNTEKLKTLIKTAREAGWTGPITYAALPEEQIDWEQIEDPQVIAGINLYWSKNHRTGQSWSSEDYDKAIKRAKRQAGKKSVVITEFGSVPQEHGLARGGGGYNLEGQLDYAAQEEAYKSYLPILRTNNVGYFAYAFNEPKPGREHTSFGIVERDETGIAKRLMPAAITLAEYNRTLPASSIHGTIVE